MNRIDLRFQELAKKGHRALVTYIVAGDPSLNTSVDLALELEKAGADLIELGIPFSDPLADGIVNQLGCQRALESGTTIPGVFDAVRTIREKSEIPIVFFTYYNPVYSYGLQRFLEEATAAGADGALILDLPPEEAGPEWQAFPDFRRISLIAPTTPLDRMKAITGNSSGFIYYVSRRGVTGMQDSVPTDMQDQVQMIREMSSLPVCVGFGISNPEQATEVARHAEGVVVGSALVDMIGKHGHRPPELLSKLSPFVTSLADAVHPS
jgi:tryptophan synthase alpha chain